MFDNLVFILGTGVVSSSCDVSLLLISLDWHHSKLECCGCNVSTLCGSTCCFTGCLWQPKLCVLLLLRAESLSFVLVGLLLDAEAFIRAVREMPHLGLDPAQVVLFGR